MPLLFIIFSFSLLRASPATREWALYFYVAADNSLSEGADSLIEAVKKAGYNDSVSVIIEVDRAYPSQDTLGFIYYMDSTGLKIIRNLGEINTGDPLELNRFLRIASTLCPAKKTGLVLYGHASGWERKKFGSDWSSSDAILPWRGDWHRAFGTFKFNFILFDACLENNIENIYELRNNTRYILGSETLVPASAFDYDSVLLVFYRNYTLNTVDILNNIANQYIDRFSREDYPVSISLIDMSKMDSFIVSIKRNIESISRGQITRARQDCQGIGIFNPYVNPNNSSLIDVFDFLSKISLNFAYNPVVFNYYTHHFRTLGGLSVYFPEEVSDFYAKLLEYDKLEFAIDTKWPVLISGYFADNLYALCSIGTWEKDNVLYMRQETLSLPSALGLIVVDSSSSINPIDFNRHADTVKFKCSSGMIEVVFTASSPGIISIRALQCGYTTNILVGPADSGLEFVLPCADSISVTMDSGISVTAIKDCGAYATPLPVYYQSTVYMQKGNMYYPCILGKDGIVVGRGPFKGKYTYDNNFVLKMPSRAFDILGRKIKGAFRTPAHSIVFSGHKKYIFVKN